MADSTQVISMESSLENSGRMAIVRAMSLKVESNETYLEASDALRENKRMAKAVADYWAGPKSQAKAAHQAICDREKAMLQPLSEAEAIIKRSMVTYQNAVEEARRVAEREARKRQQEEAERLMAEAIEAEKAGNDADAAIGMAMAEMVEDITPASSMVMPPKASGISTRKVWKARIINAEQVPVYANGIEIRPINTSALDGLARMSRGTVVIPGIEFYEETVMSARA